MKNEYGEQLDRNGYAPSIIYQQEGVCAICSRTDRPLQRHEIFHGAYRRKSKEFGLWVSICDRCHAEVHQGKTGLDALLKSMGQEAAEIYYGWSDDDFRLIFGKGGYRE